MCPCKQEEVDFRTGPLMIEDRFNSINGGKAHSGKAIVSNSERSERITSIERNPKTKLEVD